MSQAPHSGPPQYLLVPAVLAVILAIAEPLFLQALVAAGTAQLRGAVRRPGAAPLVRVVAAIWVAVTAKTLGQTLATGTAVGQLGRAGPHTWVSEGKGRGREGGGRGRGREREKVRVEGIRRRRQMDGGGIQDGRGTKEWERSGWDEEVEGREDGGEVASQTCWFPPQAGIEN